VQGKRETVAQWFDVRVSELAGLADPTIDAMAGVLENQPRLRSEIVSLRATAARWEHLARTDSLTGLSNRRHAEERLTAEINRVWRTGRPLALILADVDGLKQINDNYGHAAGDALLRALAARLEHAVRATDVVGRWGGDEFIVICPDTGEGAAATVAGKLVNLVVATPFTLGPAKVSVRLSAGWAILGPEDDPATVIAHADQALYGHKTEFRSVPSQPQVQEAVLDPPESEE